ncbi:unnamed protein product [Phytomonas sp. Hart1]|nr:unnamed protein product [Phytomonas sp. Hart1]|eukprot:CCW66767.1 unnamed protein product [Phytomonas sp. isolate Hart1]
MPINVFLAYVDTYIGKHLLQQFEHKPTLFSVHGCVWDRDNITNISDQYDLQATSQMASICSDQVKGRSSDRIKSKADTEQLETSMPGKGVSSTSMISCRFFWRRDGASVQKALRDCEWIVVEQREAQDIFDILQTFQNQQGHSQVSSPALGSSEKNGTSSFFQKPKRFVLLSNFMSWFATPPLHGLSFSQKVETDHVQDEPNDDSDNKLEDNDEDVEIDAPYPPPPEGDSASLLDETEENNDEEEDQGEGIELDKIADKKEILTEDQYNRRIPHIKYFNWRDAEKAVASAHRAHGLTLDTFVIFAGLAYGEGEDILEPFFRQSWNATMENQSGDQNHTLPIFGIGDQRVPMIHVKDLATFTRKLLCCPSQMLPPQRYIFATDSDKQLSWSTIIKSINQAFGGACALQMVKTADNPLYSNIEHFTIDLCLERGAIKTIMEMKEDTFSVEGRTQLNLDANDQYMNEAMHDETTETGTWVSEGGFKRNIEKISLEFRVARNVIPKRVLILGPPLSGKSYLAGMLARYYKIPLFSIEDVVEAFRENLRECKKKLEDYRTKLIHDEEERRLTIKTSRIRRVSRLRKKRAMLVELNQAEGDENNHEVENEGRDMIQRNGKQQLVNAVGGKDVQSEYAYGTSGAAENDGESDLAPPCTLSPEELKEVEHVIDEKIANSPVVERWRNKIAEMERILLMKVRLSTVFTADDLMNAASSSKRAANKSNLSKKRLAKEQQRKKEEEELQQAKDALQDAPFQDQGLALMLRWRLAWPDCRNHGYILVGFPQNLQQARYSFSREPLISPATEEEALNPRPTSQVMGADLANENGEADDGQHNTQNQELSDEGRLPDDVLILCADDEYLLKRWNALSGIKALNTFNESCASDNQVAGNSAMLSPNDGGIELSPNSKKSNTLSSSMVTSEYKKKTVEAFNEELEMFKQRFGTIYDSSVPSRRRSGSVVTLKSSNGQPHSMLNYFECAISVSTSITPGGRRIRVHQMTVQKEPLIPPPAPKSKYELPPPAALELAAQQKLGPPHYFGKTPLEVHQETVRRVRLEEERICAKKNLEQEIRNHEQAAYEEEFNARENANRDLLAIQAKDRAALEERKDPLQKFLMKQVMPLLSKGLVKVCEQRPENPTEYLAEWLLRHNPHNEIFSDL